MSRIQFVLLLSVLAVCSAVATQAAEPATEIERNKAVARSYFDEAMSKGRWDVYTAIHSPDFVSHNGPLTATFAEDLEMAKGLRATIPDGTYAIVSMVAEGDLVAVYWRGRGTNTGSGNDVPATGKAIDITGFTLLRFSHGKIVEDWTVGDRLTMRRQLGLLPPGQ